MTDLSALHHDGQTFLTWRIPQLGTGWTFRVYAAGHAITRPGDPSDAALVATVGDSSWFDRRLSQVAGDGQFYGYAIDSAATPLDATQGLCVLTPVAAGSRGFAVTAQLGAEPEDTTVTPGGNTLLSPIGEAVETPRPVYQRTLVRGDIQQLAEIYTLWTTPQATTRFAAMANRTGLAFDCALVRGGAPPTNALMIVFHPRGGDFLNSITGSRQAGEWVLTLDDPLPNLENTFWFGYHEDYDVTAFTHPVPATGVVRDYTRQRVLHTLRWAFAGLPVDTMRVYAMGTSMGGIACLELAFWEPRLLAGVYAVVPKMNFSFLNDPNPANGFNTGGGLRNVVSWMWGDVATNLPGPDGVPVYVTLNDDSLAIRDRATGVPPIIAFNGRNDVTVGWAEKIGFYDAMQAAHLGGILYWDGRDHLGANDAWEPMQQPRDLYRFRRDLSFPAFSACGLDRNPGDGHLASGDSIGCINAYVDWDPGITDQTARWEVVLSLRSLTSQRGPWLAPDSTTVDVTPRRLQHFLVAPNRPYAVTVTRVSNGAVIQSWMVAADAEGVLTVPAVKVHRTGTRLTIVPGPVGYRRPLAMNRSATAGAKR